MTQAIGNLGLFAKNFAAKLDEADGKKDNKISASVWNNFVKDKGGKELKYSSYISLENAEKSITQYMYDLHLSSKNSIDNINSEWINTFNNKKTEQKTPKKYRITTADGTPFEKIQLKSVPVSNKLKQQGLKAITARYDGNRLVDTLYFYNDGKIVREYIDPNKSRGTMHDLVTHGTSYRSVIPKKGVTEKAKSISISLPNDASANAKSMAKSLENNKAKLMSLLKIDNKTYNEYARLTLAIADRETNFGEYCRDGYKIFGELEVPFVRTAKYNAQKSIVMGSEQGHVTQTFTTTPGIPVTYEVSSAKYKRKRIERANTTQPTTAGRAKKENDALSCGFTQIKFDNVVNSAKNPKDRFHNINKNILDKFTAMGITKASDLYNPEKCAIATLIWMSYIPEKLETEMQEEHAQRKDKSAQPYYNLDAHLEASNGYNGKDNKMITNIKLSDIIACRWNTSGAAIQDGTFNPNDNKLSSYISDASIGTNHCLKKYTIT